MGHSIPTLVATIAILASIFVAAHAVHFDGYVQIAGLVTKNYLINDIICSLSDLGERAGYFDTALVEGQTIQRGWSIWESEVNSRGIKVGNNTYGVNITVFDIGGSYATAYNVTEAINRGDYGNYDFLFGPFGSDPTLAASLTTRPFNRVLIANMAIGQSTFICEEPDNFTCFVKGDRISPNTFGSTPTSENNYGSAINLLVIEGARSIAIFSENAAFPKSARVSALQAANDYGLNVVMDKIVINDMNQTVAADLVAELAQLQPDIVFGAQFILGTANVVREMKAQQYAPKAAIMRLLNQAIPEDIQNDYKYIIDVGNFDERLKGSDYVSDLYFLNSTLFATSDSASKRIAKVVRARYPSVTKVSSEPLAFLQGEILERAIRRARSVAPSAVRDAIPYLIFNSAMGRVAFNPFGLNDKTVPVTFQADRDNAHQVIAPLGGTTTRVVYPMPTWEEREENIQFYDRPSEVGILIFTCVLIIFSFAFGIFVIVTWRNKITKAASPPFLLLVIVGSILVYAGVLLWSLDSNSHLCIAIPWLLVGGFALMYAALFSRTYRLVRIFRNRTLEVFKVPDYHLYVIVVTILAIGCILLILWSSVFPQEAVLVVPDINRPILNYFACQTQPGGMVFLGIIGVYIFALIVVGGVMAIMVWSIKFEVYNESKQLGFGIYNLLFFIILAVIVSSVFGEEQREISYVLRSVCINLGTCITIAALFIPKVYIIVTGGSGKSWGAQFSSSTTGASTSRSSMLSGSATILRRMHMPSSDSSSSAASSSTDDDDDDDDKCEKLQIKVNMLKARVKELKAQLRAKKTPSADNGAQQ